MTSTRVFLVALGLAVGIYGVVLVADNSPDVSVSPLQIGPSGHVNLRVGEIRTEPDGSFNILISYTDILGQRSTLVLNVTHGEAAGFRLELEPL